MPSDFVGYVNDPRSLEERQRDEMKARRRERRRARRAKRST